MNLLEFGSIKTMRGTNTKKTIDSASNSASELSHEAIVTQETVAGAVSCHASSIIILAKQLLLETGFQA